ncbi:MAG: hypothetical protein MJ152_03835 [Clostridia bacterium]|nr:hypothetical protein [Clostridia bacterium]
MEKLFDTSKLFYDRLLKSMFRHVPKNEIDKIIDAGSGKISASILLKYFPKANVDAIIHPGDNRKKNPLESNIGSDRLEIVEADICKNCFRKQYDLCLVHLTLGEALNFGNSFESLFGSIMDIRSRYFVVVDVLDDPSVHFRYMEAYWKERGFEVLKKKVLINPHPEHYPKVKYDKYKLEYDDKHYVGYILKKIK